MLKREEILAAQEPPADVLDLSEWGGKVGIRRLTAQEVVDLRNLTSEGEDAEKEGYPSLCRLVALFLCDDKGTRLFADDEAHLLMSRGADLLRRIVQQGLEKNQLTKESRDDLRKNSESGQISGST